MLSKRDVRARLGAGAERNLRGPASSWPSDLSVWAVVLDGGGPDGPAARAVALTGEDGPVTTRVVSASPSEEAGNPLPRSLQRAAESADVVLLMGTGMAPEPGAVWSLVSEVRAGADVAVANAEASRTDPNSLRRRAGRRLVQTLLSPVESLQELAELRGGCHAYRSGALRRVLSMEPALEESGEGVLVELLLRLAAAGGEVVQVPVEPGQAPRIPGWTVLRALARHRRRVCRIARARALESRLRELAESASRTATSDVACRFTSIVVASAGIVLTFPLMVIIGILIKATSPGPIVYTQTRVGRDRRTGSAAEMNRRRQLDLGGKPFTIYKFRTMYADYADTSQVWAEPDDPRVTPVGRFLRKFRLDELPQLFNVLAGEMNIVGPRPEQPKIAVRLRSEIEGYQVRHRVPPGITGRAQVYHSYDQDLEDVRRKVAYDLEYLARRSLREDVEIMLRTVPVVIFRKGAW